MEILRGKNISQSESGKVCVYCNVGKIKWDTSKSLLVWSRVSSEKSESDL